MSQPATEAPTRGRAPAGGGNVLTRKMLGVPGWGWIAIIAVGAGAFLWWRNRKSSSSQAGQAQAQPASATCYDANGNTVDCTSPMAVGSNATDYFEALYAQNEGINSQLQTIGPTVSETGQDVDTIQQQISNLAGPPSTAPPVGTQPVIPKPGPVTDLTVDVVSPTLARVSWRPPQFASHAPTSTTYSIQIVGKDPAPHPIGSRTSYNVGGLRAGTHYTAVVAPAGGPTASKAFVTPGKVAHAVNPGGTRKAA
jgi:hypothetical protein